jgi:hypothetical protein
MREVKNLGDWKSRISTLWLMNAFSIVSLILLGLFESGDLTHIAPPLPVNSWSLLLISVAILGNLVMAFLSQSLGDKVNRWINIVVGAVYSVGGTVALIGMLMGNPSVLTITPAYGTVFTVLVVWIAWKSEQKA